MSDVLTGDWAGFERMLSEAGSKFKRNVGQATKDAGKLIEQTAVKHIESQDLGWPPLSEKYAKRKAGVVAGKLQRSLSKRQLAARLNRHGIAYGAKEDKGTLALRLSTGGNQVLVAEGRLMGGIRYRQTDWKGGQVTVNRPSENGSVNLAGVHEMGSSKRKIPKRAFMEPTAKEVGPKVARLYEEAVEKTFK